MSQKRRPEGSNDEAFRQWMLDLLKLFGKFTMDLSRLLGRGAWMAYRNVGKRTPTDTTEAPPMRESVAEAPPKQKPTANTYTYVDVDDDTDEEAAAMLEELLRASSSPAPAEPDAAPQVNEAPIAPLAVKARPTSPDLPLPAEPDAAPQVSETPPAPDSAEEQARRKAKLAAEEEEKARVRDAMRADMERIRAEQAQRKAAFEQAELARRQREQATREQVIGQRLEDAPPTEPPTQADDNDALRGQRGQ